MIITLGGHPLSGKGTVAKLLCEKLGYEYWSAGTLWRDEAAKKGMELNEFHEYLQANPEFDRALDEKQAALATRDNLVVDSRLGFHFLPEAYKIYLDVNLDVAAQRLVHAKRGEEAAQTLEQAREEIVGRREHERAQHRAIYAADSHDKSNFDLVIDTSSMTPHEVVDAILAAIPQ